MKKIKELGDFQTPFTLAEIMIDILKKKNFSPEAIVEPTCGLGSILLSSYNAFHPHKALGIEIQKEYVARLKKQIDKNITIMNNDFFDSIPAINDFISNQKKILFVGNPPWVTNSELSAKKGNNLPKKSNIDNLKGIEAITGKSNFDISEYIIMRLIDLFSEKESIFAFLCKTSVAHKIMNRIWKNKILYNGADLYRLNSKKYFSAAVDACFFVLDCSSKKINSEINIFDSLENPFKKTVGGFFDGIYLNDIAKKSCLEISGKSLFVWRSGIKHDCAKVMELELVNDKLINGYGEEMDIEEALVFPYMKSSDLAGSDSKIHRFVIATQRYVNESTNYIKNSLPKTWRYLNAHFPDFQNRKSVIYKNKPLFSVFAVGNYTFKPYKIAISGLYKSLHFRLIEPADGKTVLLDDTCNFISFDAKEEAELIYRLLTSRIVMEYLNARISWESKRPIKTEILNNIDLAKVADRLNFREEFRDTFSEKTEPQQLLFA